MDDRNVTLITTIHFLGLQTPKSLRFLVFFIFVVIYSLTVCGNLLIVVLVISSKNLYSPMYFLLSQLSVSDVLITTDILPNTLNTVVVEDPTITLAGCITQYFFFVASECLEILLLTVMSYDRYLAICKPLHYALLMSHQTCWILVATSWIVCFLMVIIHTYTVSTLQFCGPNVINHFFCDREPLLQLSCSDTTFIQLENTLLMFIFAFSPFIFIIVSYIYILVTIFTIPSNTGRQKAFSTCSSHLTVVLIYYGTILSLYLVPSTGQSLNITKYLSLLYTAFTPLINPIIYSLRNKDLRQALDRHLTSLEI